MNFQRDGARILDRRTKNEKFRFLREEKKAVAGGRNEKQLGDREQQVVE